MEALSWALTAAAVLLVVYALRVIMQDRDPEKPGKKAGLGCGFFFLACLLWSLAAHRWVGGWLDAFRLGMGIFLATPAIGALTKPHGARLLLGVIGLVLGIVLAGPVVKDLVTQVEQRETVQLPEELEQLKDRESKLAGVLAGWEEERLTLAGGLQAGGYNDFAALQADPAALANLERLSKVEHLLEQGQATLTQLQSRVRDVEDLIALKGDEAEADELADLLGSDVRLTAPTEADLTPVEEYARQKRLEALFEDLSPEEGK